MKRTILILAATLAFTPAFSQEQADPVAKLVAAENYFAATAKEKGVRNAFLSVLDPDAIVFNAGAPVNGYEFYKSQPKGKESLFWEPVYARVSKSGDWGFTTGPFIYKLTDTSKAASYGDYLSVWKRNKKGVWKLAFDIGVSHPKPAGKPPLDFANPESGDFFHQRSLKRLQEREDIILSTDKLYATVLGADNAAARKEFLADDTRLLFPWSQPIIGKIQVNAFWNKQLVKLNSEVIKGARAVSGELAYTYGNATIAGKEKSTKYNYLRIWAIQPGYTWNVIAEVYTAAQ